jgi:hypothetical protein
MDTRNCVASTGGSEGIVRMLERPRNRRNLQVMAFFNGTSMAKDRAQGRSVYHIRKKPMSECEPWKNEYSDGIIIPNPTFGACA